MIKSSLCEEPRTTRLLQQLTKGHNLFFVWCGEIIDVRKCILYQNIHLHSKVSVLFKFNNNGYLKTDEILSLCEYFGLSKETGSRLISHCNNFSIHREIAVCGMASSIEIPLRDTDEVCNI